MQTSFTTTYTSKTVEKLISNPEIMINHFMFGQGEGLPVHTSNSKVYMIILKGVLSLRLDDSDQTYPAGQVLTIPYGLEMDVRNEGPDILELFVLKAPHPDYYQA